MKRAFPARSLTTLAVMDLGQQGWVVAPRNQVVRHVTRALNSPIAKKLGAVLAGAGVAVTCVGVNSMALDKTMELPPFSVTDERFDLDSFVGRYARTVLLCDPRLLFATDDDVNHAVVTLTRLGASDDIEASAAAEGISRRQLWDLRQLNESAVHPDTGEVLPRPFRMSGYVPYNGVACAAMVLATTTPWMLLFNWMNQSHNAAVNFFNRNATSSISNETLAKSYCGAVGAALTVSFGLSQLILRRFPANSHRLLKCVALPSCLCASATNCYIMRSPELETGWELNDVNGNVVANGDKSRLAARQGIMETIRTRMCLSCSIFVIPSLVLNTAPVLALAPIPLIGLSSMVTIASFGFGLPAAIAVFPQRGTIQVSGLEPEFQNLCDNDGNRIDTVTYNRGL